MFSVSLKTSGMKWKADNCYIEVLRLCYRMCLQTGPWGVYIAWSGSKGKDQIVLLLSDSWKTFKPTSIYQEVAHARRAWALCVLGPLREEWPKVTILLSPKPTGYRSPQKGELRTQTRAFWPRPSALSYPHEKCFLQGTLYLRANKRAKHCLIRQIFF